MDIGINWYLTYATVILYVSCTCITLSSFPPLSLPPPSLSFYLSSTSLSAQPYSVIDENDSDVDSNNEDDRLLANGCQLSVLQYANTKAISIGSE